MNSRVNIGNKIKRFYGWMYRDLPLYVLRLACKITTVCVLQFAKNKKMHRIEAENRIKYS